jgi:uracil-DNA glycosylase
MMLLALDRMNEEEDLLGEPLRGREGELFRKLILRAGLDLPTVHFLTARDEPDADEKRAFKATIDRVGPRVIVPVGDLCRALLRTPLDADPKALRWRFYKTSFFSGVIAPWYSPRYVLDHGAEAADATVEFFNVLKERSLAQ